MLSEVPHAHGFMVKYDTDVLARNELIKIKEFIKDREVREKSQNRTVTNF